MYKNLNSFIRKNDTKILFKDRNRHYNRGFVRENSSIDCFVSRNAAGSIGQGEVLVTKKIAAQVFFSQSIVNYL